MSYKENDKSKAICENCEKIVKTTFKKGNFELKGVVHRGILQGHCDDCGAVVAITTQGALDIRSKK